MSNDLAIPFVQSSPLMPIRPTSLDEFYKYCEILSKSSLVPKEYQGKPQDIFVAGQWGLEIQIPLLQALQCIVVINGRPCLWGDTPLAIVRRSGLLDQIDEEVIDGVGRCTVQRRNERPVTRTFSLDDAKRAGLLGKQGPWQNFPTRMLQLRARGFALRDVFPDVLRGMYIREEIEDSEPVVVPDAAPIPAPTRTEALRLRLAQQVPAESPPITLDTVLRLIAIGDLDEAAEQAKKLPNENDKKAARRAYAAAKQTAQQALSEVPSVPIPMPRSPLLTEQQFTQIQHLINSLGITHDAFSRLHGDTDIADFTEQQAQQAIDDLLKIQAEEQQ